MSKEKEHADELRRRAEELFAARDSRIESLERADLASLAHELAVHQIELEIQNEELRRSRALAEEARDRYVDLYDFAPVGYFTLDEHSRIVEANLTGCRLLNAERHDLLKKRFTKFILDQETDKFYFHRRQVLESGARQTCELRMQGANGTAFDARLESVRAVAGRLRVAVTDATEYKQAEEALRELNVTLENRVAQRTAELRYRARQLQKLALDMSDAEDRERRRVAQILHDDLQQVLAAAKFHLSIVRDRIKHDPSTHAVTSKIDVMLKESIEKSRSLSHELDPVVLHHDDFTDTLRWLADEMQAKHGLIVHVRAHGSITLQSDTFKACLYKATQELLFNIVKHAGVNEARMRLRRVGRCICLSISDRGRGFDSQKLRQTAGFGLWSVRERIEMLGGRLKIRSVKGRGSTFFIIVPDGELAETDGGIESDQNGYVKKADRVRVLLADDHDIVREGLASLLREEAGVDVIGGAADGREAVEMAERLEPDVVIIDMTMPRLSGDEATRQIKQHRPNTRVIALSMSEDPDTVERMRAAGAEAYVLKTAPSEELLAAIRGQSVHES